MRACGRKCGVRGALLVLQIHGRDRVVITLNCVLLVDIMPTDQSLEETTSTYLALFAVREAGAIELRVRRTFSGNSLSQMYRVIQA